MNKLIKLFFGFVYLSFSAQQREIHIPREDFKKDLEPKVMYAADHLDILTYIESRKTPYKLIYTFTSWCKPCKEEHPLVRAFEERYKDKLSVVYFMEIYDEKKYEYVDAHKYLQDVQNTAPIFVMKNYPEFEVKGKKNKYKYLVSDAEGKMKRASRYWYLTQKLVPGHGLYGYGLMILYDEKNRVIYSSTYKETKEEIFAKLEKYINH
ncbi:hypothetical protein [Bergeyella zoohelcum]|uniref:TlpA family protein disulfide reductase n=1 Tax=Bergeyella zoohelcum TaxID=1015 RepID=UPI002A91EE75|nr:hypothetical protein [Bergeyella zoohelcum]MDY6026449.1 hypothetical protein [Bergeyella zoohelcum]